MSDAVKTLPWPTKKITLRSDQRLLIETAHGLIEVVAVMDRSHGKQVALSMKIPPDLRFRKGDKEETVLHGKFLDSEGRPTFTVLTPVVSDDGHELKQVTAMSVQQKNPATVMAVK